MLSDLSLASSSEELEEKRKKITFEVAFNEYMNDRDSKSISHTKSLPERTISEYSGNSNNYASHLKSKAHTPVAWIL